MAMLNRIRELRIAKGYSQKALAQKLGIAQPQVNAYENGQYEPDIERLTQIASLFDTTVDYIVGHSDTLQVVGVVSDNLLDEMEVELINSFRPFSLEARQCLVSLLKALNDEPIKQSLSRVGDD